MSRLPAPLDRIAARCGQTAALRVAARHAGAAIRLPDPRQMHGHPLGRSLGAPIVTALIDLFGAGAELRIPRLPSLARLDTASAGELARALAEATRRRRSRRSRPTSRRA